MIRLLAGVAVVLVVPMLMVVFDNEYAEIAPRVAHLFIRVGTLPMPSRLREEHRSILLQDLDEAIEDGAGGIVHGAGLACGAVRQVPASWRVRRSTTRPGTGWNRKPLEIALTGEGHLVLSYSETDPFDSVVIPKDHVRDFVKLMPRDDDSPPRIALSGAVSVRQARRFFRSLP